MVQGRSAGRNRDPAIVLGELQASAEFTRRQDATKARAIEVWINELIGASTTLPFDALIAREWARLFAGKSKSLSEDAMIAASARVHGLVVVTRNVKDFEAPGVEVFKRFTFVED